MDAVHMLNEKVPYVHENVSQETRETFAILMGVHPSKVPDSLVEMWWEAQYMANRLQAGSMDVRHMAILILLDRSNGEKAAEKKQQQVAAKAADGEADKARKRG